MCNQYPSFLRLCQYLIILRQSSKPCQPAKSALYTPTLRQNNPTFRNNPLRNITFTPKDKTKSANVPRNPASPQTPLKEGYFRRADLNTLHPAIVSCMLATPTTTFKMLPITSVMMCRLRPLIFFRHQFPDFLRQRWFLHFENQ